jgi:hypothetical protein
MAKAGATLATSAKQEPIITDDIGDLNKRWRKTDNVSQPSIILQLKDSRSLQIFYNSPKFKLWMNGEEIGKFDRLAEAKEFGVARVIDLHELGYDLIGE